MIKAKQLRQARRTLRLRAHEQHPDLIAADITGPSIEAALLTVGVNIEDIESFLDTIMRKNHKRLAEQGLITQRQQTLYAAAVAYGIALGLQTAELAND